MADRGPQGGDELRLHLLVLRCQAGDEQAFARLMEGYGRRTLGYLTGLVGDDAEDVQQEVWLSVYRGIRNLSNPGAFRTWLYSTTRHRAIDFLRRRKREREILAEDTGDAEYAEYAEEAEGAENLEALDAILAQLPTVQREAMLLRYRDEMSYAEIAVVVGCAAGTVRSRLHHAKRRVQELIEQNR